MSKKLRVFLDTSVIFAAILSPQGGSRKLFQLGEAGVLCLVVGPVVLRECEEVVRMKKPASSPYLAHLLATSRTETSPAASKQQIKTAREYVLYRPDAHVLAEAMQAKPDWFVTHDKEHFLKQRGRIVLPFEMGTPSDLLQRLKDEFTLL